MAVSSLALKISFKYIEKPSCKIVFFNANKETDGAYKKIKQDSRFFNLYEKAIVKFESWTDVLNVIVDENN
jgi:hypothetical protein